MSSPTSTNTENRTVRCRFSKCDRTETKVNEFQKCGRCYNARYCSQACQEDDWDLHKLMCHEVGRDRSLEESVEVSIKPAPLVAGDADIIEAIAKVETSNYIDIKDKNDNELFQYIMSRVDMHTNPFMVYQRKMNKQTGFLFVQSTEAFQNFRFIASKPPTTFDRDLICMFMTETEFRQDVVSEHPNTSLKNPILLKKLADMMKKHVPSKEMVVLGCFGCNYVDVVTLEMAPADLIESVIADNKHEFAQMDCLELYLDRQ